MAVACSGGISATTLPPAGPGGAVNPIRHVVFVVQENRSFNNFFLGYPGAETKSYGYDDKGRKIRLRSEPLGVVWDIDHSSKAFFVACNGKGKLPGTHCAMNGWRAEQAGFNAPKDAAYSYVKRNDIAPYWQMAEEYALADRAFASNLDGSFVAHQYIVAAYASGAVDFPTAQWGCEGGKHDTIPTLRRDRRYGPKITACFENATIASEADAAGVSWRFYADALDGTGGFWWSYQADRPIFESRRWSTNVIDPAAQFLTDVANGTLADITWITPTWTTSDHPGFTAGQGPAWVASVVNAVGTSRFWDSTAIFVIWDDWGGFYDPVKPVYEDYDGLGFRVPLLILSPYTPRGAVTHVQYETSSVLRFMEDGFGLAPLAPSDARANDPALDPNAFDFNAQPRPFQKIRGARPYAYWMSIKRRSGMRPTPHGNLGD
jgi:phospholipase C